MSSITIQRGHVGRTRGATGTIGEQAFTEALGTLIAVRLRRFGWTVHVVDADPPGRRYPATDLFLALHADGSSSPTVGKASCHYPRRSKILSARWAAAWRAAHQDHGYRFGYRGDNYVGDRVGENFYAWRQSRVAAGQATPAPVCLLVEHYFATNPTERAWADSARVAMADAHVDALGAVFGHPNPPANPAPRQEIPMTTFDTQFTRAINLGLTNGDDRNGTAERDEAAVMVVRGIEHLEKLLEVERAERRAAHAALKAELAGLRSTVEGLQATAGRHATWHTDEETARAGADRILSEQLSGVSSAVEALEGTVAGLTAGSGQAPDTGSQDPPPVAETRLVIMLGAQVLAQVSDPGQAFNTSGVHIRRELAQ